MNVALFFTNFLFIDFKNNGEEVPPMELVDVYQVV